MTASISHLPDCPTATPAPPEGYKQTASPSEGLFTDVNGPLWQKRDGDFLLIGFRVEARHCNPMGVCHGGMLMTLADMAIALGANHQAQLGRFVPTISLTTDFLAPAPLGAWLEARTDVLRVTRKMLFAQCLIKAGAETVVRASGVFKLGPELKRPDVPTAPAT